MKAMIDKPITSTIIWMKSVHAIASMPPKITYANTDSVPITMPVSTLMALLLTTLNTNPNAVICAATQPK